MVCDFDLDCVVIEEFGGSFALDLVAFFASGPMEANRVARIFDFETSLQGAEGDLAACAVIVSLAGPQRSR